MTTSYIKYTIASLLLSLSLLIACKSKEALPADQVYVSLSKSARAATDITVRVDSLSDGRCPRFPGVVCIWEGEAVVSLSVSKDVETQKRRLKLRGFTDRLDTTTVQFNNLTYRVVLQAVTPYPGEGQAEKQAVIQITKL